MRAPREANDCARIVGDLLGAELVATFLFGSAAAGGLREDSDVDVLVIARRQLTDTERQTLVTRLLGASGSVREARGAMGARPIELTVLNRDDVVPWRYPPRREFIYGEWLRECFERGYVPEAEVDPDLAIVVANVLQNSVSLHGPEAHRVLHPVPDEHVRRAMRDSLPDLMAGFAGDERNVLLTLARMWRTAATRAIVPKDAAAAWALAKLPGDLRPALESARQAYRGELDVDWTPRRREAWLLANHLRQMVERTLMGVRGEA